MLNCMLCVTYILICASVTISSYEQILLAMHDCSLWVWSCWRYPRATAFDFEEQGAPGTEVVDDVCRGGCPSSLWFLRDFRLVTAVIPMCTSIRSWRLPRRSECQLSMSSCPARPHRQRFVLVLSSTYNYMHRIFSSASVVVVLLQAYAAEETVECTN